MENYNLESARELINSAEKELSKEFEKAEEICEFNSEKVLKAFQENRVNEADFGSTTGYGYGDIGREKIEKVFADVLKAEDCIVRGQFISGTHALTVALFAFLRPGDTMLSINGKPYDTLDEVIGIAENPSSLKSFGVKYEQIDLINDDFDYEKITESFYNRDLLFILVAEFCKLVTEGLGTVELLINRGKANISNLVNLFKLFHNKLADFCRGDLSVDRGLKRSFNFGNFCFKVGNCDMPFFARTKHTL